jgi:hypothetical protein
MIGSNCKIAEVRISEVQMTHSGSCLCGAFKYTVTGDLLQPNARPVENIPATTMHPLMCPAMPWRFKAKTTPDGFSHQKRCGAGSVKPTDQRYSGIQILHDWTAIAMGAFDTPTGTKLARHIFVSEKVTITTSQMAYGKTANKKGDHKGRPFKALCAWLIRPEPMRQTVGHRRDAPAAK